jgi:glucosamine-phosphate N-acetyltransferase
VAAGTLLVEPKFLHGACCTGHIEDIVVDKNIRRQRLGFRLVDTLIEIAKVEGLHQVMLDCADRNIPFYESLGLQVKDRQMELKLNLSARL